jgi:signal transduction histidine kinase
VEVPGAAPAAVGVPGGLSDGSAAAVDAVAGLLGMSLQRVELSAELGALQEARAALSGRILEEGTRERSRIALEIHDDVLPYLAAAEIQADNVRSFLQRDDKVRAEGLAAKTQDAIHGGIGRLREVLAQLRNQIIVPGSLRDGLREALDELKLVHGVTGDLVAPQELDPLPLAVEILVLETVRGCLANVANHARAHHVVVTLAFTDSGISATVCDDGRGFDPDAVSEGSQGLSLMAQRVDLARGRFLVNSAVGQGTRVHVEVPL